VPEPNIRALFLLGTEISKPQNTPEIPDIAGMLGKDLFLIPRESVPRKARAVAEISGVPDSGSNGAESPSLS
jgi:hypothetical protein